ncbi:MAG: hypothetical protein ABIJ56_07995 [Pseudomonadota bacterium]
MTEPVEVHNVEGSVVDCLCPKCENDTEHTIMSSTKRRVREVKCEVCQFIHKYSNTKKIGGKDAKPTKRGRKKKQKVDDLLNMGSEWEEEMDQKKMVEPVDYRLGGSYAEGTVINHPAFGVGIVKKILSNTKIETLFQAGRKFLVQNIKK